MINKGTDTMKTVKTKIVAALTALALGFSTVAVAKSQKEFYRNQSGVWTIFGHSGEKNKLPPACVLNQNDDTLGFQYVWGFFPKNLVLSMFSFQDLRLKLNGVGKLHQGSIVFTHVKTGKETKISASYFVVTPTSFNFSVDPELTEDMLGAVLNSSKIVFHYDNNGEFTVHLNGRDFPAAIGMVGQCIKKYFEMDAI